MSAGYSDGTRIPEATDCVNGCAGTSVRQFASRPLEVIVLKVLFESQGGGQRHLFLDSIGRFGSAPLG